MPSNKPNSSSLADGGFLKTDPNEWPEHRNSSLGHAMLDIFEGIMFKSQDQCFQCWCLWIIIIEHRMLGWCQEVLESLWNADREEYSARCRSQWPRYFWCKDLASEVRSLQLDFKKRSSDKNLTFYQPPNISEFVASLPFWLFVHTQVEVFGWKLSKNWWQCS